MNFLGFPSLVQSEILQNFSNTEKVLLSFCSTKSAQVIRNLRLNINRLLYTFGSANIDESPFALIPGLTIHILDENDKKDTVLVFLQYNYPQLPDDGTMLLPIGGMNIRLRHPETRFANPRSQLQYLKLAEDRLITSIQDHMNFIFPRLNDRKLVIVSYDDPKFEKFKNLNEIRLIWGDVPAEKMETLKMDHPELTCLRVGFNRKNSMNNSLLQ